MRREFSRWIENFGRNEPRLIFLTGDLGFGALENVQNALQERFVNMGVCEQNMISVAAGLSQKGLLPAALGELPAFRPIRKLAANRMPRPMATVVGLGPVLLNALSWILDEGKVDLFVVAQIPPTELSDELVASVHASGLLWVIEEHVARGGLAEHLALQGVRFRLCHTHAVGYPDGLYGSQSYHQSRSGLDSASLQLLFRQLSS